MSFTDLAKKNDQIIKKSYKNNFSKNSQYLTPR